MKKFVCKVCGYIYEGEAAPAECPVCHAKSNMFEEVKGELKLAAEHELRRLRHDRQEQPRHLRRPTRPISSSSSRPTSPASAPRSACTCAWPASPTARAIPEIGLYWEKAAYEEAEHAAKFAELLGEELEPNMKATTKENLAWRVDCEFGATAGKVELATCAKKNGLDAIHDTVHEMARDEARHGQRPQGPAGAVFQVSHGIHRKHGDLQLQACDLGGH